MRRGLTAALILVSAALCFAQETGEWYQGKPIRSVNFSGLRHVSSEELAGITESCVGRTFTDDLFWELQGRLYALEYFESIIPDIVPQGDGIAIQFQVSERPVVARIVFSGNAGVPRRDLLDAVTLKVNDMMNQMKLSACERALVTLYQEKGYPDARVHTELQRSREGDTVTIAFIIEEGDKITIEAFRFEGNDTFSDRTLRGQLSLKVRGVFNDGAFQEAKLVADRAALLRYYHDRGYIDAEILDVVQDLQKDETGNNNLIITFRIYEGRAYNYGGLTFEGNRIFSTEQLDRLIHSRPGRTVNSRQVEADYQRVADLYYENGYIFNTINQEERRNAAEGIVYYHIRIVERGRAHIESIVIRGNEKTRDHVILREIPLEPGDVYSRTKITDAYRNLYNLQFFSNVIVDTQQGSADSLMNLIFDFEEQPTTNIQFGMTFSGTSDPGEFPVAIVLQYQDRNFRGFGNILGGDLNFSRDTQSGSITYTQRWLFGLPLDGGFDLTVGHSRTLDLMDNQEPLFNGDDNGIDFPDGYYSYSQYYSATSYPAAEYLMTIEQWNISLGFGTGYRWLTPLGNLLLRGGIRVGFEYNTYDDMLYRPFDPVLRDRNNSWVPALSLWGSVSLDTRDIYYDPSSGYYLSGRLGYYGFLPQEREKYIKPETKAEIFFTLFRIPVTDTYTFRGILGFHSGLSFILPQPFSEAPQIEKANQLLIDGMFIGRGWDDVRLHTRGRALWENWAELRFPLVPGMLALDLFFDAVAWRESPGNFFTQSPGELLDHMYFSLGFGPRISIPQFPFRFLFASRFRIQDGQIEWYKGNLGPFKFVLSLSIATY
ncbi:MAG: outer membrane protein assembly factor BamA [Spirochaetaceae bacterium]|jgi:outer membrane protein insertion porin family|nr:outer membrane protein assembly factor BamA [Spirochaetaceae bacterium]